MRFQHETPTFCCGEGSVRLVNTEVPIQLYELLVDESDEAKEFRRNIRAYNSIFAFMSFGVRLDKELASSRKGVYTFKAQEANLSEEVVTKIRQLMDGNPYAQFLCQLKDHSSFQDLQIRIAANATLDQRVYNKPSVDQIAAIWVDGNNPNVSFDREIIVHEHSDNKHRVKHYYGCYDPLQYPLLFPNGEQFVVDMYIKLETTRLEFFRLEQALLRREIFQGIVDSIMAGEYRGDKVGQRVILSASFIGGPREMHRRYMDAMALVQRFGKPDLFIIMTCNPDWAEIQENLCEGQFAQDRPDLIISADQYDKFISAELPDEEEYPLLHDLVIKHMMHGPCGKHRPTNSCMKDGQCKNHYPRPFSNKSIQGKDGYPIYKRRNDGKIVNVRGMRMHNQWVVPYNPYLLTRYNCHINVESCSGVKANKYLYKYIYKGHDRCVVYIKPDDGEKVVDEIQNFQDARWVSPPEALWRIYEFNLSEMQPPVLNLQLHLPDR
ncbi:uncharacterized protein LOC142180730 [Nicotiana tabacum]|uniref:Uncharacterized protein LOC142180730 n=1 Tax=Nicotiana tabacum TaxID=4097 RepID=A0AC58UHC3_TOBAC